MNLIANRPVVNLFAGPECDSDLVSQLLLSAPARTLEERGDWALVQGPDGYQGWADLNDFVRADDGEAEAERLRISPLYANLRYRPCKRTGPMMCVPHGVVLPVVARESEWVGLRLPDGRVGWLEEKRTESPAPFPAEADALLQSARLFLGVPYLWGGVSGFGIDCSGFVQAVFGRHGFPLPRDAHQQAEHGEEVSREAVRPGDLLYFAPTQGAPRRRITHVAMAVDSGTMIHALGGESVVETSIEAVSAFWGARRVMGSLGR